MPVKAKFKNDKELAEILNNAWLGVDAKDEELFNPIEHIPQEFSETPENYLTYVMIQPEYLAFVCKHVLNIHITPQQALIIWEMWDRRFPMLVGSRGFGKSFIMAVYTILRLLILPGRKVVVAGAGFRQSKFIYEYTKTIYNNAPILRDIISKKNPSGSGGPKGEIDVCSFVIGDSKAFFIPIGDGSKIRGYRANDLIADEFSSINREVFEIVLSGFLAVKSNPIEEMKRMAYEKKARELGVWEDDEFDAGLNKSNQLIISGTASYEFDNFGQYWKKWRSIIRSKGQLDRLKDIFVNEDGEVDIPENFDYRDYSIIRMPFELIQRGLMDESQIARAKATMQKFLYQMEYGAVFPKDSIGFFKRSLIETCTVSDTKSICDHTGNIIVFDPKLKGDRDKKYVIGVDPASESDNLAITVLEVHKDHRRIVYCWTTNRKQHKQEMKAGLTKEHDYYSYCARKIRNLIDRYPCDLVGIDKQGGGVAIIEALQDPDKYDSEAGEVAIWEVIDPDKPKDTDMYKGLHIVELIQFANPEWTYDANHGLRKDMEDKALLFPRYDAVSRVEAMERDKEARKYINMGDDVVSFDTMEDCIDQIEELKYELSIIVHEKTNTGRDRWDTPEVKEGIGKKGRLKKDRYSSLLIANACARKVARQMPDIEIHAYGGFAHLQGRNKGKGDGTMYYGNEQFAEYMKNVDYGAQIKK